METTSSLMLQFQDYVPKNLNTSLNRESLRFAEMISLASKTMIYPEIFLKWNPKGSLTAKEARRIIFVLSFSGVARHQFEMVERLFHEIYKLAEFHHFEGTWKNVKEILEHKLWTRGIHGILRDLDISKNDFYGNFIKDCIETFKRFYVKDTFQTPKEYTSKRERLKGIPRKVHRRGANDKTTPRSSNNPNKEVRVPWKTVLEIEAQEIKVESIDPPPRYWFNNYLKTKGRRGKMET